jgi:hypothetical protein
VTHALLGIQAALEWKGLVWRRHTITSSGVMTLTNVMTAGTEAVPQTLSALMLKAHIYVGSARRVMWATRRWDATILQVSALMAHAVIPMLTVS